MARAATIFLILHIWIGTISAGIHDNSVHTMEDESPAAGRGVGQFPVIGPQYTAQGTLFIPYAEIAETFKAWVDLTNGQSRIDFYGGVSKTFQLANKNQYGVMRKIVPFTTETVLNQETCFEVNGTKEAKVGPQSILPDATGFTYSGDEVFDGQLCRKYTLVEAKGQKINKYTYWIKTEESPLDPTKTLGIPIKYEMRGYNTLLGSHYDHYYLVYDWFANEILSQDVFKIPETTPCRSFPGPGAGHHRTIATFNPMKEFIHNYDDHINQGFQDFVTAHNKKYAHDKEQQRRQTLFRHNFRFIHSKNRQGLTYKLAVNHLADRTEDEIRVLRGKQYTKGYNGGNPFPYEPTSPEYSKLPASIDWRLYGAVTPVKDQSVCGSCWSFGTVGAIEGAHFLKTGNLIRFSQQALVDCSWGFGNNGCDGGEDFRSYQWMMKHGGIPSADSYGPYLGIDGYCHVQNTTMATKITGYVNVTSGDLNALKLAIFKHGPISVAIDASHKTLSFYANGVYYEPKCGNKEDQLDHAVLAVGYGTLNGEKYWLVKNSWSTYWGNDGYVLMSQKDNNCGVATTPTYVTM